jgi:adhesin transport system outer membrane protein
MNPSRSHRTSAVFSMCCKAVGWGVALALSAQAQTTSAALATQPLQIGMLLDSTNQTHPLLLGARIEAQAAQTDVEVAQRQRLPTLSALVESNTGNAYSQASHSLRAQQTLWDAGLIDTRVAEAENTVVIGKLRIELQQKQLFLQICTHWQSMVAAHQRMQVAQKALSRLDGLKQQMQRRIDAQASAPIDLILANARQLQTQVEYDSAQRNLKVALQKLELLSGMTHLLERLPTLPPLPTPISEEPFLQQLNQTNWAEVGFRWPAVQIARFEVVSAQNRLHMKEAERWPQLYLRADKPVGNYVFNANTSTTLFAGLNYSTGAGFSTTVEARALGQRVAKSDMNLQAAMKDIQDAVLIDREEFINAYTQIIALQQAVTDSQTVLDSFERQFQANRKTWVDLLNQVRELAQNEYALGDAQSNLMGTKLRLQLYFNQDISQATVP